jgi:hypothetical protein
MSGTVTEGPKGRFMPSLLERPIPGERWRRQIGAGPRPQRVQGHAIVAVATLLKLTIFAATGVIGRQVLGHDLAADHDVTALGRDRRKRRTALRGSRDVRVVTTDLTGADPSVEARSQPSAGSSDVVQRRDRRAPCGPACSV